MRQWTVYCRNVQGEIVQSSSFCSDEETVCVDRVPTDTRSLELSAVEVDVDAQYKVTPKKNGREVVVDLAVESAELDRFNDECFTLVLNGSARVLVGSAVGEHKRVQVAALLTREQTLALAERSALVAKVSREAPASIPMRLHCPSCHRLHVDEGIFATTLHAHHTHACQHCGEVWRPAIVPTVGVQFLPGFKNEPAVLTREEARHARNKLPVRRWRHRVTGEQVETRIGDSDLNADYIEVLSACKFSGPAYVCLTCDDVALAHWDAPIPKDRGCKVFDGNKALCAFCRLPRGWH